MRKLFNRKNAFHYILTLALRYQRIMSFHKPQTLYEHFSPLWCSECILSFSGHFAFWNYPTRPFVVVKRFENILIHVVLQSLYSYAIEVVCTESAS